MAAPTHRPALRRRAAAATVALVLALGAAACSDDGDDGSDRSATTVDGVAADEPGSTTPEGEGGVDDGDGGGTAPGGAGTGAPELPDPPEEIPGLEGREKEYADAMVSSYDPERDKPFQLGHVQCLANRWVPIVGVERFEAAGLEPADLTGIGADMSTLGLDEATAEELVDAMELCNVDVATLVLSPIMETATPEQWECIEGVLSADDIRRTVVNGFLGVEDDTVDAAFDEAATCLMQEGVED